jgi:hypothetical protein
MNEMKKFRRSNVVLALLTAVVLISCSQGGGTGGTGFVAQGPVTAFGSIVVNGTVIDVSNAVIIVNGETIEIGDAAALANLDIGRIVTVTGRGDGDEFDAVASRVDYRDDVRGPVVDIVEIDPTTKQIVVMGQTVIVNALTNFQGTSFDTIAADDVVDVSGFVDDTGAIRATFLEKTGDFNSGVIYEVTGSVTNLDSDPQTFQINDLAVDYSMADTSGLPGGVPTEGQLVEVAGSLDNPGGQMLATEIELADDLEGDDGDEIEIIGFVTEKLSATRFTVGNQIVETDELTDYVDGSGEDVAPGVKLEAEGVLENRILLADEIEFWDPDQIEVEGIVTDFVSVNEFTVGEQLVQTDEWTVFDGIEPEEIEEGIMLEVKGVPTDIQRTVLVADKVSFEED